MMSRQIAAESGASIVPLKAKATSRTEARLWGAGAIDILRKGKVIAPIIGIRLPKAAASVRSKAPRRLVMSTVWQRRQRMRLGRLGRGTAGRRPAGDQVGREGRIGRGVRGHAAQPPEPPAQQFERMRSATEITMRMVATARMVGEILPAQADEHLPGDGAAGGPAKSTTTTLRRTR